MVGLQRYAFEDPKMKNEFPNSSRFLTKVSDWYSIMYQMGSISSINTSTTAACCEESGQEEVG